MFYYSFLLNKLLRFYQRLPVLRPLARTFADLSHYAPFCVCLSNICRKGLVVFSLVHKL
jgi:hypothetical protein